MKKQTSIILVVSLMMGFGPIAYAASAKSTLVDNSNLSIQKYNSLVSTLTMLSYCESLLDRSTIALRLKFSRDSIEKAQYDEALKIYREAEKAYLYGYDEKANKLALDSIRVIARSANQHYRRLANLSK